MSSDTELTVAEETEIAAQEWTYAEIADKPELVAELQDCELRVGYAQRLQVEAHMEMARQIKRAADAIGEAGYSRGDFYRFGRDRFGLARHTLMGYERAVDNALMDEFGRAPTTTHPLELSRWTFGLLGNNTEYPDITRKVAIGEIPPTDGAIRQALAEAREAAREEMRQELERMERLRDEKEEELEHLRVEMERREIALQQEENALEELRERLDEEIDAAVREHEKDIRRQVIDEEKQWVKDTREKLRKMEEERKDEKAKLKALEKKLASATDPENIRRKWREAGEALRKELGRFRANLPGAEARLRFLGTDENLLEDLIDRLEFLVPELKAMRAVVTMVDEKGARQTMLTGRIVQAD